MTTVFKGGHIVDVRTSTIKKWDVLVEGEKILWIGENLTGDEVIDVTGKILCPGFIDGHIHIESTMLVPQEFARVVVPHGTTAVVADPHEIANVCGTDGIRFMMESAEGLPMEVLIALPSCVPASAFDEAGAVIRSDDLEPFYEDDRVVSLGEVMCFKDVIDNDPDMIKKIQSALAHGRVVNGHAPMLEGDALKQYIGHWITDDHECTTFEEAKLHIQLGQKIMVRQGTSTRNLEALIDLFDEPYCRECMLVTDDKHPADLLANGHLDSIVRQAVQLGKSAVTGIRMATIQAAEYYKLKDHGALEPGYYANILVLNDLDTVDIEDVYFRGKLVSHDKKVLPFTPKKVSAHLDHAVRNSFHMKDLKAEDFFIQPSSEPQHVIELVAGNVITNDVPMVLDFSKNNGIDVSKDILKIAVCERHHNTGHIGLGFVKGSGLSSGAMASSVSHDSHNLIVIGTNEEDMALAANTCKEMGGGLVLVNHGEVVQTMRLNIGGLMSELPVEEVAKQNASIRKAVHDLGAPMDIEPFMNMAFVSLTVIPFIKISTLGLVDVLQQKLIQ